MTKSILNIALIAMMIVSSLATVRAQKGFQIGIEGTPQLSWLQNQDDHNANSYEYLNNTFNCSFGISSQYGFTKNLGIGLNVLYSFQGQRFKLEGVEKIRSVEYVKVPLMFNYNCNITDNFLFIGKIGPQLGILTNAQYKDKDRNIIVSDQKSAYANYDLGGVIHAGFGYNIFENFMIDASLRFDYGFTNSENRDYKLNINNPVLNVGSNYSNSHRAMTSNMTAGLTIGFRFLLN